MFGKSLRNFEEILSMFDEAMWIIQRIFEWDDFALNDLSQQVFIDHWRHIWTHPESYPSTHTKSIHRNRGKHKRENDSRKSNSRDATFVLGNRALSELYIVHLIFVACSSGRKHFWYLHTPSDVISWSHHDLQICAASRSINEKTEIWIAIIKGRKTERRKSGEVLGKVNLQICLSRLSWEKCLSEKLPCSGHNFSSFIEKENIWIQSAI